MTPITVTLYRFGDSLAFAPRDVAASLASEGAAAMEPYPWLIVFPGLALTVTLFSLNFLGDGLRDALDPQVSR